MTRNEPQDPLPRELLPRSSTERDSSEWNDRIQSLMVAAAPILADYRTQEVPWWFFLTGGLRPRLAFAAAAAAAIMVAVHLGLPIPETKSEPSLPLATVIGDGAAATAFWSNQSEDYDPVLALLILEGEAQ